MSRVLFPEGFVSLIPRRSPNMHLTLIVRPIGLRVEDVWLSGLAMNGDFSVPETAVDEARPERHALGFQRSEKARAGFLVECGQQGGYGWASPLRILF